VVFLSDGAVVVDEHFVRGEVSKGKVVCLDCPLKYMGQTERARNYQI
jgi:hypothetical protein